MKHLFLCGFMGSGKTTIGRAAAKLAGIAFLDLDDFIIEHAGMAIPEMFSKYGESYFRELETAALAEIAFSPDPLIVATGGGALISEQNAILCQKHGEVLFLDVPFETCYRRIFSDPNRPIASSRSKEELLALYQERRRLYRAHCSEILEDAAPETLAETVAERILELIGEEPKQ